MFSDVGAAAAATDILSTVMEEIKAMGDSDSNQRATEALTRIELKCRDIISAAQSGWY